MLLLDLLCLLIFTYIQRIKKIIHLFLSFFLSLVFLRSVFVTRILAPSLLDHVVRQSQFKIRFKLQDWLWLSVVPSEFLPTRNLAFNGILPCC